MLVDDVGDADGLATMVGVGGPDAAKAPNANNPPASAATKTAPTTILTATPIPHKRRITDPLIPSVDTDNRNYVRTTGSFGEPGGAKRSSPLHRRNCY
jgi:hypothetical protein